MSRFHTFVQSLLRRLGTSTHRLHHAGIVSLLAGFWFAPIPSAQAAEPAETVPAATSIATDQTVAPDAPPPKGDTRYWMMEDILKMREFFDTTIPGTLKKYKFVFSISPRATNARKGEFIRLPVTLRYGLGDRWEIYGGLTPFIPNPVNSGKEHRWGTGEGKAGVRYDWGHWGKVFDRVTVGIENRSPLGTPPDVMTDHFSHVMPFINTSRTLPWKDTTGYINLSYDYPYNTPHREAFPDASRNRIVAVTPSILYKPGEFGAYVEYGWRYYDQRSSGRSIGYEIKAGPIWDIPLWRTQSWGLPGKWQVEYSCGYTLGQAGESNFDYKSVRVRWRTTFKEVFSKKSYQRVPHVQE